MTSSWYDIISCIFFFFPFTLPLCFQPYKVSKSAVVPSVFSQSDPLVHQLPYFPPLRGRRYVLPPPADPGRSSSSSSPFPLPLFVSSYLPGSFCLQLSKLHFFFRPRLLCKPKVNPGVDWDLSRADPGGKPELKLQIKTRT
ncbi:hypothetical protein ILYODFUR_038017 [Ilyodon furcidens]|uniref:Uncharacterized protein n=1 Tax=Ilyodon furcidens TaxID=33524 RepID=A0ABV0TEH4_9TELE